MGTPEPYCPRCGAVVKVNTVGDVICPNDATCGTIWTSKKSFDHECVARDLSGKKSKKFGKDYLEMGGAEGTVGSDLAELVQLVSFITMQTVYDAVVTSIKGREHMISGAATSRERERFRNEVSALAGMRDWIRLEMDAYGETFGDKNE